VNDGVLAACSIDSSAPLHISCSQREDVQVDDHDRTAGAAYGAWNPGLESELPRAYVPLATVFRAENVSTSVANAHELHGYCGLPAHELVTFRPERLIVHELLVRVTSSIAVPDGPDYEDLGRDFRRIASTVLDTYIAPHRAELAQLFERTRRAASALIARELETSLCARVDPATGADRGGRSRLLSWLGRAMQHASAPVQSAEARERRIQAQWSARARRSNDRLEAACLYALSRIATAVMAQRGRLPASRELLAELAVTLVCNDYGSEVIGEAIEPFIQEAVLREGYRPLPPQERPVVMNVKGASASGKSTMRPLQRILARKLGFPWEEFALISPDIWRKFLLDYGSLGAAYKYAGTMTGHEVEIVDKKLDRHMADKASRGETPHLLIDRFRFDSFVPAPEGYDSTRLLTRFGDLVYMFFMITPPEMTVERAWTRGLKVGRYKAVDDLLAHNVEAYSGMPELFFTWALDPRRRVHYEFLDNSVAEGRPPRTVAFGWNREMTVLDVRSMLDIERFRKINVNARRPEEVYVAKELAPQRNVDFLKRCARLIPIINFADYATGRTFARLESEKWVWRDERLFCRMLDDPDIGTGLKAIAAARCDSAATPIRQPVDSAAEKLHTLGAWAEATVGEPTSGG
jgi:hypothetical protein